MSVYLFITDKHQNYICLQNQFKGANFPSIVGDDLSLVSTKIQNLFGSNNKFYVLNRIQRVTTVFYHVIILGTKPLLTPTSHSWSYLNDHRRGRSPFPTKTNTMVFTHLQHVRPQSPLIGAGVIISDPTETWFLLVHGVSSHKFGVPKGHILVNEDVVTSALRETHEETGIQLSPNNISIVKSYLYRGIRLFRCVVRMEDYPNPVPLDTNEISKATWMQRSVIDEMSNITKLTRVMLNRYYC
jgi:8-oxo-dGTP pyrophosphatase MutT (NUDIX family)